MKKIAEILAIPPFVMAMFLLEFSERGFKSACYETMIFFTNRPFK